MLGGARGLRRSCLRPKLVDYVTHARLMLFVAVGVFGVFVHLAVLRLVIAAVGVEVFFPVAQAIAAAAAMTGNFLMNNVITYRDRRLRGRALLRGLLGFYAVCSLGAVASVVVASGLFGAGWRWWLAGIAGAAVGALWNYAMSSALVWRSRTA